MSEPTELVEPTLEPPPDEVWAWCAGLPFDAEREPTQAEREHVESWRAGMLRLARRRFVLGSLPVAAFFALHLSGQFLAAMLTLVLCFVSPFVFMSVVERWRLARRYQRDLHANKVWVFAGHSPMEMGVVDEYHQRLVGEDLLELASGASQSLVALPLSRQAVSANGTLVKAGFHAEVVEVATPPASSLRVDLPPGLHAVSQVADIKRRRLTPHELAELRGKVKALRRLGWGFWVLTALWGAVFLIWRRDGYPIPPTPITQLIPAGLWFYTMYEVVKHHITAWKLNRDMQIGWVFSIEPSADTPTEMAETDPVIGSEVLPTGKHSWTIAGTPAAWRGARSFSTLLINRHGKHDP